MRKVAWSSVLILLALLIWLLWPQSQEESVREALPSEYPGIPEPGRANKNRRPQAWLEVLQDDDPPGSLRMEGQVLDENDLAVDGAQVFINTNPGRSTAAERDGSFVFDGLISKSYRLTARQANLVGGPVEHRLTASSQPVIIRLTRGSEIEVGVLSARTSHPLAGAQVELGGFRSGGRQTLETDADGLARFEGVAPGFCTVTVQADGFSPAQRNLAVPRGARDAIRIQIVLDQGVRISGMVITEAGDPVAGARVVASESGAFFPRMNRDFFHALSDPQGQFIIPVLAPGNYRLTATHSEHPQASTRPLHIDRPKNDIQIVMVAGASIQGLVVSANNTPVPWAEVRLRESGRGFRFRRQRGTTADQNGEFRFAGLARKPVRLMAIGEDSSSEVVPVDLTDRPEVSGLRLRLVNLGRIAGRVVDSQGQPAPEVYVSARADFFSGDAPRDSRMRRRLQTVTDGGGRFAFAGLAEGTYRLMASRIQIDQRGRFMRRSATRAQTGDEDVLLTLEEAGGIRGRVVLATGDVPERFGVEVDWNPAVPFSSESGDFEITPVSPGEHRVTILGEHFADHHIPDVRVVGKQITDLGEIVIQPGRIVSGRVVDSKGQPVEGSKVMADRFLAASGTSLGVGFHRGDFDRARSATTAGDGSFRLDSVSTESRLVAAEHSERGRSDVVRIPPGKEEAFVELVLHGFGSVEGLVTSAMTPVSNARVTARPAAGGTMTMVSTGADGRYLIEKLPEGQHRLDANRSGGPRGRDSLRKSVNVLAGETTQVNFQFDQGPATLVVDVQGQDGALIDMAWVSLFQGRVAYTLVSEIFAASASFQGTVRSMPWMPGRPARFAKLVPDEYSVCVVPLPAGPGDFRRMHRLRRHADRLRVYCFPIPVANATEEQQFNPVVPPQEPLPEEETENEAVVPDAGQVQRLPGPHRLDR